MKHEANFEAASTHEGSPYYHDVILERNGYRIIRGRETRDYAKQWIVQKRQSDRYRNISYHLDWRSIGRVHGAWLINPDSGGPTPKL